MIYFPVMNLSVDFMISSGSSDGISVMLDAVGQRHSRVPVLFGDPVQAGEHDGQDDTGVLLDQTHDVLVVPVV